MIPHKARLHRNDNADKKRSLSKAVESGVSVNCVQFGPSRGKHAGGGGPPSLVKKIFSRCRLIVSSRSHRLVSTSPGVSRVLQPACLVTMQ